MADDKKPSIFQKMVEVSSTLLDAQLAKAKNEIAAASGAQAEKYDEANFEWGKAVTRDRSYYLGSQGFQEKAGGIGFEYQKQMALKSSIIAAIVKTFQNKVASHSEYVPQGSKAGFRIVLKHEQEMLDEIQEELFGAEGEAGSESVTDDVNEGEETADASAEGMRKAFPPADPKAAAPEGDEAPVDGQPVDPAELGSLTTTNPNDIQEQPLSDSDKLREAKKELDIRTREKKREIADFIQHCGDLEDRPFETKKWSFNAYLRAIVWDSLVFDQIATEVIPKEAEILNKKLNIHHFQPVDGSTIRYASDALKKYKDGDMQMTADILYPDAELEALEQRDALELDPTRLETNQYKFVQVVRGRIARAFTEDELKVGMRNPVTDIYANGYSVSELELLVALVTSHLQTEFYNRSYFQQGFSAKGILHIKANLNRSKLEELRRHWNHMVKGNKNSFQTPIMAGMDEVQWIPLTQSHSEMEFSMWLNYLIRMICAIYQIDPAEIGYGIKDEGKGGLSGDNTKEKLANSKDKGFVPLMKFLQEYLNKQIIDNLDPDYKLEWVGLEDESDMSRIARQKEEVQWKKTLNEIRAEDGLPPIKGADNLLLNPVFFQWFSTMSDEGKQFVQEQQAQAMASGMGPDGKPAPGGMGGENTEGDQKNWEAEEAGKENDHMRGIESKMVDHGHKMDQIKETGKSKPKPVKKSLAKSIKVEYYKLGD